MIHDRYYYAARAAEERRSAMAAENLKVRETHLELAVRYDAVVDGQPIMPDDSGYYRQRAMEERQRAEQADRVYLHTIPRQLAEQRDRRADERDSAAELLTSLQSKRPK